MKTYEITFIDLGFLVSPELWAAWFISGLVVGYVVVLHQLVGSSDYRVRRARAISRIPIGRLLFTAALSVVCWPAALYLILTARVTQ